LQLLFAVRTSWTMAEISALSLRRLIKTVEKLIKHE
jgi:hypothetical protein